MYWSSAKRVLSRMPDGAEEHGIELLELFERAVGQDLAGSLVAFTAKIEALVVQLHAVLGAGRIENLHTLGENLGAGAVSWNQRDVVRFHGRPFDIANSR
jgi:hypothetical protein